MKPTINGRFFARNWCIDETGPAIWWGFLFMCDEIGLAKEPAEPFCVLELNTFFIPSVGAGRTALIGLISRYSICCLVALRCDWQWL
ncbi:hypothetical protein COO20_04155 [Thalassospira marina]|uniref:Uncharacterized protein n=1 Tax=Thalassospira marina TaxID=2048283 RepID=A0A2N3KXT4_9PROT|nr:hypothetical protein COO20_04155 [Thalassospira marina]